MEARYYRYKRKLEGTSLQPYYRSSNLQKDLGACPANGWYRIVVFPLSSDHAGTTSIDFTISYYQAWTEQYIHLYINGEYDKIRWPESGNNPKIIKIKHVAQKDNKENE